MEWPTPKNTGRFNYAVNSLFRLYELLQRDISRAKESAEITPFAKTQLDRLSMYLQTYVRDELVSADAVKREGDLFWKMNYNYEKRLNTDGLSNPDDAIALIGRVAKYLPPTFLADFRNLDRGVYALGFNTEFINAEFPGKMTRRTIKNRKSKNPALNQLHRVARFSNYFTGVPENVVGKMGSFLNSKKHRPHHTTKRRHITNRFADELARARR